MAAAALYIVLMDAAPPGPPGLIPDELVPPGYMQDARGRLIPDQLVRPDDLLEDQVVRKMIGHAEELSARIARFRGHCFDDVGTFLALIAEQYGASRGGAKGNITLRSYDGRLRVTVQVADQLQLGPQLQVARELIDQCIAEWAEGSRDEIRALVQHAFRTDKEGQVSREALFALRRVQIDDERWQAAMEAIADSVRVVGSKTYIRFHRRDGPDQAWQPITIDLAAA